MKVIHSNQNGYQFYPLDRSFLAALNLLGDQIFGADYLLQIGLEDDWEKIAQVINPISFCVVKGGGICAARISYPPGQWSHLSAFKKSHPELWPTDPDHVAYFKLSMVHPAHRRQGLAKDMANLSLAGLRSLGAKGVLTHSWNESPGGSSGQYISKMGFQHIADIPNFWSEYVYKCLECKSNPCVCTASEMYLQL
jgi:ribosomal protein S18 acetylase RimI-like enzyme